MLITSKEILEMKRFEGILEFLNTPQRLYQVQEEFGISRGEAHMVIDKLEADGYIRETTAGWRTTKGGEE